MRSHIGRPENIGEAVDRILEAGYIFSNKYPGLLKAATAYEALLDAESPGSRSMLQGWGRDWAHIMRGATGGNGDAVEYDSSIVGQAILGAIGQGSSKGIAVECRAWRSSTICGRFCYTH